MSSEQAAQAHLEAAEATFYEARTNGQMLPSEQVQSLALLSIAHGVQALLEHAQEPKRKAVAEMELSSRLRDAQKKAQSVKGRKPAAKKEGDDGTI